MAKKISNEILIQPIITEKSLKLVDELNQYTFLVDSKATRDTIAKEVADRFNVNVLKVRTIVIPGKRKMWGRRRLQGRRSDSRKAIVTLKSSDSIDLFKVK